MFFLNPPGMITFNRGNMVLPDFASGNLTLDGAWYDLDLSNIVPVGTKFVQLQVGLTGPELGKEIRFREKGQTGDPVTHRLNIAALAIPAFSRFWIGIDNARKLEYYSGAVALVQCDITVVAWKK